MSVLKTAQKMAEDELAKKKAEDEKAIKTSDVPEGKLLVRLIRPLTKPQGGLYAPGIYTLPREVVPESAIVLKGEIAVADSDD